MTISERQQDNGDDDDDDDDDDMIITTITTAQTIMEIVMTATARTNFITATQASIEQHQYQ